MSKYGFTIVRLALTGPNVATAEVAFKTGLNVISGPSDTGKTYIFECLDYAMGGAVVPKSIPEASGYDEVVLEVQATDKETSASLRRSLKGGDTTLETEGEDDRILSAKYAVGTESISSYFLNLAGLAGNRVRKNKRGTTRDLSFRDVARLVLISEEQVIKRESPILSGRVVTKTVEQNVFRLMLTGIDDSSVVESDEPRLVKGRGEARLEIIQRLQSSILTKLETLGHGDNAIQLADQLARVEAYFEEVSGQLSAEQANLASLEVRRRELWNNVRRIQSRLAVFVELQKRFDLLEHQYKSDLQRLEATAETSSRLAQLPEQPCSVCGAMPENHGDTQVASFAQPADVAEACSAEAAKIRVLLDDLKVTLKQNEIEIRNLTDEQSSVQISLDGVVEEVRLVLQPQVRERLVVFRETQKQRDSLRDATSLLQRRSELDTILQIGETVGTSQEGVAAVTGVRASEAHAFSQEVLSVLADWKFPNLDQVSFSDVTQDIVVSGRERASHGKGVRAIMHAAFNIALLNYCHESEAPHPGFVTIDSPLVVYREPEPDEAQFSGEVKTAFYQGLAAYSDRQVIVLENDDPPPELDSQANVIRFTGTKHDRNGFIPVVGIEESVAGT